MTASMVKSSSSPKGLGCVSVFIISMLMPFEAKKLVIWYARPGKSVPWRKTRRHREVSTASASLRRMARVGRTFTVSPGISSAACAKARWSSGVALAKETSIMTLQSLPRRAMRVFSTLPLASKTALAREETRPGRSGP